MVWIYLRSAVSDIAGWRYWCIPNIYVIVWSIGKPFSISSIPIASMESFKENLSSSSYIYIREYIAIYFPVIFFLLCPL